MSYTPINWQTGQTITAEKLNKMDNGWSYESSSTVLYDGSVTTVDEGDGPEGTISYNELITLDTITVTFDNTKYTCAVMDLEGAYGYGGMQSDYSHDFTVYPFAILSSPPPPWIPGGNPVTTVYTETAGTYTIKIEGTTSALEISEGFGRARGYWEENSEVQVGEDFTEAVKAVPIEGLPFMMTVGETTYDEFTAARAAGRPCFCKYVGSMVFVGWPTSNGDTYDLTIAPIPGAFTLRFNSSGILEAVQA